MSSVDVVIPCYNYARFLRQCVTSVLNQESVDVRVLIIDDCSSDESARVGLQLAAEDARRVHFRRHEINRGHISTYNEGLLEWASADYCLLLSADDMLMPGALQRATKLMDAHPEVGFAYGRAIHTADPSAEVSTAQEGPGTKVLSGVEFIQLSCEEATNLVPTPTAVVRTSLQKSTGGYRHALPHSGDMEMWLRIAANASVGVIDAEQAFYRVHARNMSVAYEGVRDLRAKKAAFDAMFEEHGTRIENVASLRQLACFRLADHAFAKAVRLFELGELASVGLFVELAAELSPQIRLHRKWATFSVKRLLGPGLSHAAQFMLRPMRRKHEPLETAPAQNDWLRCPWMQGRAQPESA